MPIIKQVPSFYSDEQLGAYLQVIGLEGLPREPTMENLNRIMRNHLIRFAWENTPMHYTESGEMDVTPEGLYERFVNRKGGSYCIGQNTLMLGMLRAMGYRTYGTAGRVNENAPGSLELNLTKITHMVLFVQFAPTDSFSEAETYIVDVGYGLGIARPLLLKENNVVMGAALPEMHRLVKALHPESSFENSAKEQEDWWLQVNLNDRGGVLPDGQWRTLYQFAEKELFLNDFAAMSFCVAQRGIGLFHSNIIAVMFTPWGEDTLGRKVLSKKKVSLREGTGFKVLRDMKTEQDRITALREEFNIHIDEGAGRFVRPGVTLD